MSTEGKHHISELFNLPANADLDFFDANLAHDLPVFIDPFLLKNSPNQEEKALFERFGDYFRYAYDQSINLSTTRVTTKDFTRLVTFHEPRNINMGYTEESNKGKGAILTKQLLDFFLRSAARKYVRETEYFPDQLYNPISLQVFTDGIGPDGISDITANLIMDYLIRYTQEQAAIWNIPLVDQLALDQDGFDFEEMEWRNGNYYQLPENPLRPGEPLIFVPRRLLRGLEEVSSERPVSRVVRILRADPDLSSRFSGLLEKTIKEISLEEVRNVFITEGTVHFRYLKSLESERNLPYNFDTDFLGLLSDKDYSSFFDGRTVGGVQSCDDLRNKVEELIEEFNKEFSQRDGWKDAWKENKHETLVPQTEPVIGRRFRGMGYAYFKQLPDVTFIPEAGTGNGLVDFHIIYKNCRALVELKLLNNSSTKGEPPIAAYLHGIQRQLPQYVINSDAKFAYYLTGQHYAHNNEGKPDHSSRLSAIQAAQPQVEIDLSVRLPI